MKEDNVRKLKFLQNEYNTQVSQAMDILEDKGGVPSYEEGMCWQRAAEICSEIIALTTDSIAEKWEANQKKCADRIREIARKLNPEAVRRLEEKERRAERVPSSEESPEKEGGLSEIKGRGEISADTIRTWFEYPLDHGFDKVAGMDELKKLLTDCVTAAGMSRLNQRLKMSKVRSYFFYGLPGCGKTYIVEAFAYELKKQGYTFMSLTGGQIHSQWQGIAEQTVEEAFRLAEEKAPSIIFIDEIESVCRSRTEGNLAVHVQQTTTAFLNAYNRLKKSEKQVIFIGATNYPSLVDAAMMDRVVLIEVTLPDRGALTHKFRIELEEILRLEDGLEYEELAEKCEGYSYRDVEHLLDVLKNEISQDIRVRYNGDDDAAVDALESGEYRLTREFFEKALNDPASKPSDKSVVRREIDRWRDEVVSQ